MPTVEHDPATGLLAVQTETTVQLLDAQDLAIAGTVLIRLACAGHTLTPRSYSPPSAPPTPVTD
jgi:hypothetical protein